jgi:hypothetical protein
VILLTLLQLLACAVPPQPEEDEVLTLSFCPDGLPCALVADGQSLITVEACVPEAVTPLADDLTLSLVTSGGAWIDGAQSSLSVPLGPDRCARPALTAPTHGPDLIVEGSLAEVGVSASALLTPASFGGLALTPSPAILNTQSPNLLTLTVSAWGEDGASVSEGSLATVTVIDSEGSDALVSPAERLLDEDGEATFTVTSAAGLTELTLRVVLTAPTWEGVSRPANLSEDLTLSGG